MRFLYLVAAEDRKFCSALPDHDVQQTAHATYTDDPVTFTFYWLCALRYTMWPCWTVDPCWFFFLARSAEDGPCTGYRCTEGSVCIVKNDRPSCMCPSCSEEFRPVSWIQIVGTCSDHTTVGGHLAQLSCSRKVSFIFCSFAHSIESFSPLPAFGIILLRFNGRASFSF